MDYHVYTHWRSIVDRRSWSANGGPWRNHPREVDYSAITCAASLDLLSRAVHVDVSPDLTDRQTAYVAESLTNVLRASAR